jgi:hypothetical protein
MPLPSAEVSFLPQGQTVEPRLIDRIKIGEEKRFQYFDPAQHDRVDAKGFKIRPTGLELIVEVDRFSGHVLISRVLLADPNQKPGPEPERLLELASSETQLELDILSPASELGRYIVHHSNT